MILSETRKCFVWSCMSRKCMSKSCMLMSCKSRSCMSRICMCQDLHAEQLTAWYFCQSEKLTTGKSFLWLLVQKCFKKLKGAFSLLHFVPNVICAAEIVICIGWWTCKNYLLEWWINMVWILLKKFGVLWPETPDCFFPTCNLFI